jgi:hypothetical protein
MPTARINPNITIFDTVMPIRARKAKHSRNDVGMAKPTSNAARMPNAARTTIITSAIAVKTDPKSCWTIESTIRLWSFDVPTVTAACKPSGQAAARAVTISCT